MRIAITGATGTVGRHVIIEALRRNHQIVGIDLDLSADVPAHANFSPYYCDVADYAATLRALDGAEAVIHLATQAAGSADDSAVHNRNVTGSYNVLRASAELDIKRICLGSSVNAIGLSFSRIPRFQYFPIDESHRTYNEDPYGLSKWITEMQADSIARRYEGMTICSLRFHWVVEDRSVASTAYSKILTRGARQLWGYTKLDDVVSACFLALSAPFKGHQIFNIVAPDTGVHHPSIMLARHFYPGIPIKGPFEGNASFFSSRKATEVLGYSCVMKTI